jgi:hypothetical protein
MHFLLAAFQGRRQEEAMSKASRSALSNTEQMIVAMERKVASQWERAKGSVLVHSAGLSWRGIPQQREEDPTRRVIARRRPTGRRGHRRRSHASLLAMVLAVGLGLGSAAYWGLGGDSSQRPMVATGTRLF